MKNSLAIVAALGLAGCAPSWPADQFPQEIEIERTLFAAADSGFRETCMAIVAELTDEAAIRVMRVEGSDNGPRLVPPSGWNSTPLSESISGRSFYRGAFGGCNEGSGSPLGDLQGSLSRPGAFYKIVNGGEGIAIIVPRAKLAGFYYFG